MRVVVVRLQGDGQFNIAWYREIVWYWRCATDMAYRKQFAINIAIRLYWSSYAPRPRSQHYINSECETWDNWKRWLQQFIHTQWPSNKGIFILSSNETWTFSENSRTQNNRLFVHLEWMQWVCVVYSSNGTHPSIWKNIAVERIKETEDALCMQICYWRVMTRGLASRRL